MKHVKLFEDFVNEALSSKKPNEVITIDLDMAWDDSDPEEDKAAKDAFKKYNIKVKEVKRNPGTFDVTGKKKDILGYLQSEFYEMDADDIKEYYPELLEGNSEDTHEIKIHEAIDIKYWTDYNTDTSGQSDPEYADKSKDFEGTFKEAVKDWNDMGEDPITSGEANKVKKIAKEFFTKAGWISVNVCRAMIAQEA
jgi:hypothetical protein